MMDADGETSAGPRELAIGDDSVQEAADEIRRYAGRAMLELAWTVGRVVLDRFYAGDEALWRSHGAKDVSLRRLADRLGDVRLSASSLSRCVAIYCVLGRLGPVEQWNHLTARHVRAVLPLPAERQDLLLREAEAKSWSARTLEGVVRTTHAERRRARRRTPRFVIAIRRLLRDLEDDGALRADLAEAANLGPDELTEVQRSLLRARERLERLQVDLSPKRLSGVPVRRPRAGRLAVAPGQHVYRSHAAPPALNG